MTALAVPPIFVCAEGEIFVFDSVTRARSWLEPVDVRDGSHTAFDADGRRLTIGVGSAVVERGWCGLEVEHVTIECTERSPSGASELREFIERYLVASGEDPVALRSASLAKLEAIVVRRATR